MGVDLTGGPSMNWWAWRSCLDVAQAFGWQPAGTIAPPDYTAEWSGNYYSNDFQEVTDSDAYALASALFRGIAAILHTETVSAKQAAVLREANLVSLFELADRARRGHFSIY
jgi:hypothetical protein